jgi:hypothetical protein
LPEDENRSSSGWTFYEKKDVRIGKGTWASFEWNLSKNVRVECYTYHAHPLCLKLNALPDVPSPRQITELKKIVWKYCTEDPKAIATAFEELREESFSKGWNAHVNSISREYHELKAEEKNNYE